MKTVKVKVLCHEGNFISSHDLPMGHEKSDFPEIVEYSKTIEGLVEESRKEMGIMAKSPGALLFLENLAKCELVEYEMKPIENQ